MTPKQIGQIVSAYTGILCGSFSDLHEYAEKLIGRPIFTHEFGDKEMAENLKDKSREDFIKLAEWCAYIPLEENND